MNVTGVNSLSGYTASYQSQSLSVSTVQEKETRVDVDTVTISSAGGAMSIMDSFMGGAGKDGVITLDEMRAWRDENIRIVQDLLNRTIKEEGIDVGAEKCAIARDEHGIITVNGSLSAEDKTGLENALQNNRDFQNSYAAASQVSSLIQHIEDTEPFRKAYEKNPQTAVAMYGYLIGKKYDFDLFLENGEVSFTVA